MRRDGSASDGSASSDTEDDDGDDDCDDGGSESGSSEYGSVVSFASAHTSTFAQDSETNTYVQAVEVINRHDFAVATFTGDDASRGGTPYWSGDGRARGEAQIPTTRWDPSGATTTRTRRRTTTSSRMKRRRHCRTMTTMTRRGRPGRVSPPTAREPELLALFHPEARHRQGSDQDLLPATINQPLTIIQRTVEDLEYINLLWRRPGRAGINRMTALVAFCASAFGGWYRGRSLSRRRWARRTTDEPDGACALVEQVEYFPPVCVWHVEGTSPGGTRFEMNGELAGISKFWGSYAEFLVNGRPHATPRHRRGFSGKGGDARAQRHLR